MRTLDDSSSMAESTMSPGSVRDRWRHSPVSVPLSYIVGGIGVGAAMLAIDSVLAETDRLSWLWVSPQVARSSLVGLVTSFLFVISVVFWVRIWAVQLTAGSLLPRLLSQFLTDRVQQHAMGFLIGGIAYVVTILRALPDDPSESVPHLAVNLAYVDALAVAVVIVWVIHNAARASQVGRLVHEIASDAVATIRANHPQLGDARHELDEREPSHLPRERHVIHARTSGWVQDIDENRLLERCPPRSTVELAVREGSFVLEGQPLAILWPPPTDQDDRRRRAAFRIADEPPRNLPYVINELVDIARRSIAPGTSDLTSARDAVLHLGVVIRELLLHDLPADDVVDEDARRLLRSQQLTFADYCEASLGRLRDVVRSSDELLIILLASIREISDQLATHDLPDRGELLREHARLTLQEARDGLALAHDVDRVASRARAAGVDPDDIPRP